MYIIIYNFHYRHATGEDIGLSIIKNGITAVEVIEKMKCIRNSNKWQKAMQKVLLTNTSQPSSATVYRDKITTKEKRWKGVEKHEEEGSEKYLQRAKWPSLPYLESRLERPTGENQDLLLLEIIEKMDRIILAAKQSSQSS